MQSGIGPNEVSKLSLFRKTVEGLCEAILDARCEAPREGEEARRAEVVEYVLAQHGRMPDYMALAFRIATWGFDLLGLVHGGRVFHRAAPETRWRQIESWRRGPVSVTRDFVRFYESLVVQCWYEPDAG